MTKTGGFEGIARAAGAAASAAVAEAAGEQLDLLGLAPPSRLAPGERRDGLQAQMVEAGRVRARGRPPGAQNIATQQAKAWLVRMFGDPMIEAARWLLHTPASMAAELDCTLLEAFDRQQRIREALLPFIHAKLAPVGEDGRPLPMFQLIMGGAEGLDAGTVAPWLHDPEVARTLEHEAEQNQGVSEAEAPLSQTSESQK
jgi:hypothetical protein